MHITSPVRDSDFVNATNGKLALTEEICALGRIAPSNVEPFQEGFLIRLAPVDRFARWWANQTTIDHHLYVDSIVRDRFGTTLQVSRKTGDSPNELYAAVTSWRDVCRGAQHLRETYLKNAFDGDATVATEKVATIIIDTLQVPERPVNSPLLPAWNPMKWGILLRPEPSAVEATLDYLLLERPTPGTLSELVPLGAGVVSLVAASPSPAEPIQIAITSRWNDDLMAKSLQRWLRGFEKTAQAKGGNLLTTS